MSWFTLQLKHKYGTIIWSSKDLLCFSFKNNLSPTMPTFGGRWLQNHPTDRFQNLVRFTTLRINHLRKYNRMDIFQLTKLWIPLLHLKKLFSRLFPRTVGNILKTQQSNQLSNTNNPHVSYSNAIESFTSNC